MQKTENDIDSLCYAMLYLKSELYAMGLKKSASLIGEALDAVEIEMLAPGGDISDFRVFRDFIEKALQLDKQTLSNLIAFLAHDDKELAC